MKSFKQFLNEDSQKDIVVTIPKSEYKNDDIETERMVKENLVQFWKFKKLPKGIGIGSRVYFVKNGHVESSMNIIKIEQNKCEKCTTTGREWTGNIVYMNDLKPVKEQIECKGFQGFRYKWF